MNREIEGLKFEVEWPAVLKEEPEYDTLTQELIGINEKWSPGVEWVDERDETTIAVCDGKCKRIMYVIRYCEMPARFQDRVFFKDTWVMSDGSEYKTKLKVRTLGRFERMIKDNGPSFNYYSRTDYKEPVNCLTHEEIVNE